MRIPPVPDPVQEDDVLLLDGEGPGDVLVREPARQAPTIITSRSSRSIVTGSISARVRSYSPSGGTRWRWKVGSQTKLGRWPVPRRLPRKRQAEPAPPRAPVASGPMVARLLPLVAALAALVVAASTGTAAPDASGQIVFRVDHVTDGDTIQLRNGLRVRLVQIDTPEVFFGPSATGDRRRPPRSGCCRRVRASASSPSLRPTESTTSAGSCATSSARTART